MSAQELPTERTPPKAVAYERCPALGVADQLEHLGHWALEQLFDSTKRSRLPAREARDVIQALGTHNTWRIDKRPLQDFPDLSLIPKLAPRTGVMPELVTRHVTHLAWNRPTFQLALQKIAREQMRSKWLLTREREAQIQHHPAVGWCLILLALNLRRTFSISWGRQRQTLANLANNHLLQLTHWAGYWDQHLLRQAVIDAPIDLTAPHIRWVIAMPHLRSIQAVRNAEILLPIDSLSRPDWQKDAPKKHAPSINASNPIPVNKLLAKLHRRKAVESDLISDGDSP